MGWSPWRTPAPVTLGCPASVWNVDLITERRYWSEACHPYAASSDAQAHVDDALAAVHAELSSPAITRYDLAAGVGLLRAGIDWSTVIEFYTANPSGLNDAGCLAAVQLSWWTARWEVEPTYRDAPLELDSLEYGVDYIEIPGRESIGSPWWFRYVDFEAGSAFPVGWEPVTLSRGVGERSEPAPAATYVHLLSAVDADTWPRPLGSPTLLPSAIEAYDGTHGTYYMPGDTLTVTPPDGDWTVVVSSPAEGFTTAPAPAIGWNPWYAQGSEMRLSSRVDTDSRPRLRVQLPRYRVWTPSTPYLRQWPRADGLGSSVRQRLDRGSRQGGIRQDGYR